nr:hypothetical protein [Tanacetum cinerariifolium]
NLNLEELHDDTPAETLSVKDKGKGILVEDPNPIKKKDQIEMDAEYHGYKKKPQSESEARKNMIAYLKNTKGFKMAFFKGKTYDQIRPIFQATFDANMRFLLKSKEEMKKEEEEIIKSINETPAQKAAKRRRLREQAKEDENLKKYKIIRADDTHQLYASFITLLKNFDKEDLEDLWKIMKARFFTSKPTNFSDDYLLVTLKNMFEKTDAQDVIWRSQQTEYGQALVKSWKLLTSCGVHIITFTTTMFALLVEKKYPLSRFTLEQLVNVARLQSNVDAVRLELKLFRDADAAAHMKKGCKSWRIEKVLLPNNLEMMPPIKGRSINEGETAAERISNDSEDIARVLTSMDAATILAGGINVPTGSGSIPTAGLPATVISTGSEVEDFIPMGSKEEAERLKRKEKMKEMMQLVSVKDVYVQALQVKHPIIDWKQLDREDLNQLWALVKEYLSIRPATSEKEMELWVELKRLYEPDPEDQLWTQTQNFMHAPVDKEIFMLVEKIILSEKDLLGSSLSKGLLLLRVIEEEVGDELK